jgi:ATP:ADP antiporter, AAA family
MVTALRRLFHSHSLIRAEDRTRVFLSFAYFFAVIMAYYLLKPARSSLFLKHWSANDMPLAYLTTAVVIFGVVWAYGRLTQRLNRYQLLLSTYGGTLGFLALFWYLFQLPSHSKAVSLAFYVWVSIFNVMLVTVFWSYTNDIFRPAEGKRYYGFIGTGGILGSIAGAFGTRFLVKWTGTENLLWVTAGVIALVFVGHVLVHQETPEKEILDEHVVAETEESGFSIVRKSKYLMLISALVMTATFFSSLMDFQFNKVVESRISDKDAMTAFFGTIFGTINALSFTIQLVVTSYMQRRFGIGPALMVTPILTLLAAGAYAATTAMAAISALKIVSNSLEFSLAQATKELLYIPLGRDVKYKAKAFIDMAFFRVGDALSALFILFTTHVLNLSMGSYRFMNIAVGIFYVIVAALLARTYVAKLRRMVNTRKTPSPDNVEKTMEKWSPNVDRDDFPTTESIEWEIRAQAKRYYMALLCLQHGDVERNGFSAVIKEETDRVAKRLFRLISLIHNADDIFRSIHHLYLSKNHNDVIAEELLDNVLRHNIRNEVLPLLDPNITEEDKVRHGRMIWKLALPDIQDYLRSVLKKEDADPLGFRIWQRLIQPG